MKKSLIIVIVSILFLMSSCYGPANSDNASQETTLPNMVIINNFKFQPEELSVNVNAEVTWTNNHDVDHALVSPGLFGSSVLKKGGTFKFTLREAGEYNYYCGIHPSMRGKIIVQNV